MLEYATGVIDVLEKNVFDKQDQERMISASKREDAFKVLFDTDLAEFASKEEKIEAILEQDLLKLKKVLFEMLKDVNIELFYFLFLKFDALNLKIILKNKNDLSFASSIVPFDKLKLYLENKVDIQNDYVKNMIDQSLTKGFIEENVDKAYFKTKLCLAKRIKGLALEITRFEIDVLNLKNLIKEKRGFLRGGNLSRNDLLKALGRKKGMISRGLERFLETFDLSILIEQFEKNQSEIELEKGLERFLAEKTIQREREGGGIEKVMGYFFKKTNAHSNIRLIFFQKEADIPTQEIKANLLPI